MTTLALTGLPQHLGTELVGKVTEGKALPPEVLEQIVARADGVPLFIEELTKSVLESRLLHEEDDRYTLLEPLPALAIPTTLSASLLARLDRRAGVRELAQIGACIGREFSYELLAAVSPYKGARVRRGARATDRHRTGVPPRHAAGCHLHLQARAGAGCRLRSLLKSKRQQLHAQIAEALENDVSGARRQRAGVAGPSPHPGGPSDRGDPAVAKSWRVRAGAGRAAGGRGLSSRRDWPSSIGCRHRRSATASSSRSGSRCTRHGFGGTAGQRRRWA